MIDQATRATGYIVKSVTVRDASQASSLEALSSPFAFSKGIHGATYADLEKILRESSLVSQDLHPMLNEKIIFLDAPKAVRLAFKALSKLASKRVTKGIQFVDREGARSLLEGRLSYDDLQLLFPPEGATVPAPRTELSPEAGGFGGL